MKCWYWRQGCTFVGTEEDVEEHVDYMVKIGADDHLVVRELKQKTKPVAPVTTKCKSQPRLRFNKITEEIYLVCDDCGFASEDLGYEPTVPDVVFEWEKHSTMRRKVQDDGGPREVTD